MCVFNICVFCDFCLPMSIFILRDFCDFLFSFLALRVYWFSLLKFFPLKKKKGVYSVPLLEFIRVVLDPCIVHAETSRDYCYYYDFRTS